MLCEIKNRFYIDRIGNALNQTFSKEFDFKGESHNFIEAVYVASGSVQITEDEKVYILNCTRKQKEKQDEIVLFVYVTDTGKAAPLHN